MKEKLNEVKFNYQIKGIEILDFSMIAPVKIITEIKRYNFDLHVTQNFNVENKLAFVIVTIGINDDKMVKLASFKTNIIFEVSDIEKFVDKKTKAVIFPAEFIYTLNSVAISTARGLMFSQFRGTYLHNAILPLVDMQKLISSSKTNNPDLIKQKKAN